jgi:hypothetical protein
MRTRNKPHTIESLKELTTPNGDCWIWHGASHTGTGYGVVVYKGKQTTVHRAMYQLITGRALSQDMEVDHICNTRLCINPTHLQAVSHAENMRLGRERRTHCRAGHEWNDTNTYATTVKRRQGGTREQRYCRVCRAIAQQNLRTRLITNPDTLKQLNPKRTT